MGMFERIGFHPKPTSSKFTYLPRYEHFSPLSSKRIDSTYSRSTSVGVAPTGQFVQRRQRLRHYYRTAQANDLRSAELEFFRRQPDRSKRADRIAHQLDGLGKKGHFKAALLSLLHDFGHLFSIGKLAVPERVTHSSLRHQSSFQASDVFLIIRN